MLVHNANDYKCNGGDRVSHKLASVGESSICYCWGFLVDLESVRRDELTFSGGVGVIFWSNGGSALFLTESAPSRHMAILSPLFHTTP